MSLRYKAPSSLHRPRVHQCRSAETGTACQSWPSSFGSSSCTSGWNWWPLPHATETCKRIPQWRTGVGGAVASRRRRTIGQRTKAAYEYRPCKVRLAVWRCVSASPVLIGRASNSWEHVSNSRQHSGTRTVRCGAASQVRSRHSQTARLG